MKNFASYRVLFFIIGIHVVYFLAACYFKGIYLVDSYGYLMQADNIKAYGTWYAEDWNAPLLIDYFSIRPPLYAWLIIGLRFVSGNVFLVLVIQNLLSIFNCWSTYKFVRGKASDSKKTQVVMYACLLFYPAQMMHANFVMTEIVFQTFLLLLFLNTLAFAERPDWKSSIVISILLSLCLLTKPVSLFLPFIVLGFMIFGIIKQKQKWAFVAPFLLVALTFHIVCYQNEHATNYYHYSSIKSINHLKYNAKYTLVNARGEPYADSVISVCMQQANNIGNYGERLQYMDAQANEIILEYPLAFARLYAKGVIAFFIDPGRFDAYHFFDIEEKNQPGLMHQIQINGLSAITTYLKQLPVLILILLASNLCWNILVLGALFYFLISKTIPSEFRILLFVFVFYIAAATGPVGVSRYRVPVYPMLMIGVMFAYSTFAGSKKRIHA
jgi:hypothetical protein